MIIRQIPSTVSSGSNPLCLSTRARIIDASRAGLNAEPPPCFALIAINELIMRPRSIRSECISASIRSISTRSFASDAANGSDTGNLTDSRYS